MAPPAPGTNNLLAIASHALANAQENVLGLLAGHIVERDQAAEFDDRQLTVDAIRERWRQLAEALEELPTSALAAEFSHPRRGRVRVAGFEVLVVALRHAAEHMGQAELTRDLVLAQRPGERWRNEVAAELEVADELKDQTIEALLGSAARSAPSWPGARG